MTVQSRPATVACVRLIVKDKKGLFECILKDMKEQKLYEDNR
jgi:hypothetical protein